MAASSMYDLVTHTAEYNGGLITATMDKKTGNTLLKFEKGDLGLWVEVETPKDTPNDDYSRAHERYTFKVNGWNGNVHVENKSYMNKIAAEGIQSYAQNPITPQDAEYAFGTMSLLFKSVGINSETLAPLPTAQVLSGPPVTAAPFQLPPTPAPPIPTVPLMPIVPLIPACVDKDAPICLPDHVKEQAKEALSKSGSGKTGAGPQDVPNAKDPASSTKLPPR